MAEASPLQNSRAPTTATSDLERRVMETVMTSETRGDPPWLCAAKVAQCCGSGTSEQGFPNADLASILVSNLCFSHNTPSMWKLLEQAMATHLVYPLHVLALLTSRMAKSIDDALQLSVTYRVEKMDLGFAVVLFLVTAITGLLDCTLEDWDLVVASESLFVEDGSQSMDVQVKGGLANNDSKHHNKLMQTNVVMALEVLENMCSYHRPKRRCLLGHGVDTRFVDSPQSLLIGSGRASCWVTFDVLMENLMDGKIFSPAAAFEILTGLTRTLQRVNQASWQDTFQALWISALQLVQRARDPMAGPVQYIESRLSMLLSIVPLSIAPLLNEEKNVIITEGVFSRKQSLVACLQSLTQFASLLQPPQTVVSAANDAATKAVVVVMDFKQASGSLTIPPNCSRKAVGNLLHLVVESCIAKDLIDTTAYFWPGYVVPCDITKDSNATPIQECPWLKFMQGAPFTRSLQNALMVAPVPSVIELKKLYHLALHGSVEERSVAPKILCGASLIQGWNIQEHVVHAVVKLLSPQMPPNTLVTGDANLYLGHMHMLTALLSCLSNYSVIQTLALYGMIPEVVAALMPLCEAFGSFPPQSTNQSSTGEEVSAYSVFSFAFLFLLRLCKFHGPDRAIHPYCCGGPVRPDLKLDFHLLMRNSRIRKAGTPSMKYYMNNVVDSYLDLRRHLVYVDSFPKLRAWYFENEACSTTDTSDKCNPSRMHQASNKILNFVCRNMNKDKWPVTGASGGSSTITSTSSSTFHSSSSVSTTSGSFGSTTEDKDQGLPLYPPWELLEALPLVLDAMLSACAFGKISSRDLVTGLIDLVEFFPASIATIIRYFKAEITRGTWKSVPMNGTDWPSPGEALYSLELEVKEVLERVGVHIENWYSDNAPPMLPLPLAAFLSLTITFRLDKNSGMDSERLGTAKIWKDLPCYGNLFSTSGGNAGFKPAMCNRSVSIGSGVVCGGGTHIFTIKA
ncbi:hypothetical protein LUZ61_013398 [Rhynchospora tenuis]|uniref:Mediator of RNA polymerase II transcription subunit 33A n=1 Tax=Rhynchospora tenuis TaxID=198213 RepID=A0AAD5Z2N9_9POAL|nr:hypothetical protein LUZ61_013398 [Rhynchospora tenuis]